MVDAALPEQRRYPKAPAALPPVPDVVAGVLLICGALFVIPGSFANLDQAVARVNPALTQIITTSAWSYRVGPVAPYRLVQYFGVALVVGGVLALALGLFLVTGQARRIGGIRPAGAAAAALLFGAVLSTDMSVLDDLQWDSLAPAGVHITYPAAGFWLLAAGGIVALVALGLLLARGGRVTAPPVVDPGPAGTPAPEPTEGGQPVTTDPPSASDTPA